MPNEQEILEQLAVRCEAASGPSRELDLAIANASYEHGFEIFGERVNYDPELWMERHGPISASLDAAMSLVPEGMRDELEITTLYCVARVGLNLNHSPDDGPIYASNQSNSIPLALCAAALRARAAA